MGLIGIAIVSLTLGIALVAKGVPTGDFMLSTFQAGQSFYSEGNGPGYPSKCLFRKFFSEWSNTLDGK